MFLSLILYFWEEKVVDEDAEVKQDGEVEEEKDEKEAEVVSMSRLCEYIRSESPYLVLSLFGAVAQGVLPTCEGVMTGKSANLRRYFYY